MSRNFKPEEFSGVSHVEAELMANLANVLVRVPLYELTRLKKIGTDLEDFSDREARNITFKAIEAVLKYIEYRIRWEFESAKRKMERLGLSDE